MKITKQRLKEIIIEEISEVQFGFPSLGLTLADVTPGAKDKPEDEDGTEEGDEEEPKKPERPPINPDIAAYRKKYGGGKFISTPRSNQGSDIKKRPRRYQENKQMKITKEQLKQIIKEEIEAVTEGYWGSMYRDDMGRLQYGPDPRIRKEPKKEPKKPEQEEPKKPEEKELKEADGETAQQAAERLKSMPPHRLSSVMMDFEDMADGDTSLQQYYPHVKDLAAFAREVLSLMGNK